MEIIGEFWEVLVGLYVFLNCEFYVDYFSIVFKVFGGDDVFINRVFEDGDLSYSFMFDL